MATHFKFVEGDSFDRTSMCTKCFRGRCASILGLIDLLKISFTERTEKKLVFSGDLLGNSYAALLSDPEV